MNVSYEGIGHLAVTLPVENCEAGQLCKLNKQGRMETCSEGDLFCGFVEAVDDWKAAVQIEGFVDVNYTGTAPSQGYINLSSNGAGGVKVDTAGREYLVVAINSAESKVTIKL